MKFYSLLSTALLCAASSYAQHEVSCAFTSITSDITSNTTLSASTLYRLEGCIHVTSGNTLTIPAGTVIMGQKSTTATLIIDKGAQLISQGTSTNPVIMTSDQQAGFKSYGDWGGLSVAGYAKNNNSNSITLSSGSVGRQCSVTGGGTNNSDNSGTYKFMRIEYPVYGISMVSVGSGTEFHDVEVMNAAQNSLELYGGTVNFKRFVSLNAKRNDVLATGGNLSKAQYILGLRLDPNAFVSTGDLSNGITFSNNDNAGSSYASSTGAANNHPVFSNVTLIGPAYCGATGLSSNFKNGVLFFHNTEGGMYNSIIAGWPTGFRIEDFALDNADINYTLNFAENTFFNNGTDYATATSWPANCAVDIDDWMGGTSPSSCRQLRNQFSPTQLGLSSTICGDLCSTAPTLTINTSADGYDLAAPHYTVSDLSNAFFDAATYRGALNASTDWTSGWANFCPEESNYCGDRRGVNPTGIKDANTDQRNGLLIAPNPVSGITYAEFTTEQSGKVTINVINNLGQVVRTISKDLTKGLQKVAVTTDGLSAGMYLINVELGKGNSVQARVVVK